MVADDEPAAVFLFPKQGEVPARIANFWAGKLPFANDIGYVFGRKFEPQNRKRQRTHTFPVGVSFLVISQRSLVAVGDTAFSHKRERIGGPVAVHKRVYPPGIPVGGLAGQRAQNCLAVGGYGPTVRLGCGRGLGLNGKHRQQEEKTEVSHFFGELCRMNWLRNFYREYKPYIFSDGWYYVFILVFIALLFVFFA